MRFAPLLAFSALLLLPGCDETDAVAVRLRLQNDLSGTLTTSTLELPAQGGPVVAATQGVEWNARVSVVCNTGTFASLADVKLFDVVTAGGATPGGMSWASVTIPRGANVAWAKALVPLGPEDRAKSARAFDPSGKTSEVGATIKFEVTLPASAIGNGLKGKVRGVKVSAEGEVATLIVPIEVALTEGDPLIWHLTWQS
jgi:hypothetical protein